MQTNFKINGVPIKRPTSFKIEKYKVTNLDRLANALMVGDLIAKKRKAYFTYAAIKAHDLDVILDVLWETNEIFYTLTYVENNVTKVFKCYPGSIPAELHSTGEDWTWKNVTFDLIEQ